MAYTYKHGAYGEYIESTEKITETNGTIPVYFGIAPVNRVKNSANYTNKPVLITSIAEAQQKLGYSDEDDFSVYTLSGAVFAHFKNKVKAIGPIVCINVLDVAEHKAASETTGSKNAVNSLIELEENAIVDTITIDSKTENDDYIIEIRENGKVNIRLLKNPEEAVTVTYYKTDMDKVKEDAIVGESKELNGKNKGIYVIDDVYTKLDVIPNVLVAPKWGTNEKVRAKLLEKCSNISGIWDAIVVTDMPATKGKVAEVIREKESKKLNSENEKLCYPMAIMNGKKMYSSIIAAVRMQIEDAENDGIPSHTPSNKKVGIEGIVLENGTSVEIDFVDANKLNANGITTFLFHSGKFVLWGPHMSIYKFGATNDPHLVFDTNRRMDIYLNNNFRERNFLNVDRTVKRNDLLAMVETEQIRLNALVAAGDLLYGNIEFRGDENSKSDLVQGDFTFHTMVTSPAIAKSLTQKVEYTSKGIETLVAEEGE